MPDQIEFSRVLFLAVDAWRYGDRDARQQFDLQEALSAAVDEAGTAAGLDPSSWHVQPAGDGFLGVITDSGAELPLVDPFVRELDAWLARFNHDRRPEVRLRLRLAIHHGGALPAAYGFASDGPVHVCRLRDAKPVRAALEAVPEANLVQVVSEAIFSGSVRHRITDLFAANFTQVQVDEREKGFQSTAWIRLPGFSAERLAGLPDQDALAICIDRGASPAALAGPVDQAVLASFAAAGISPPEKIPVLGSGFVVALSSHVSGGLVLGVWLHHLQQALAASAHAGVSVGIALGRDTEAARRLATGEAAAAVLRGFVDARVVLVVSDGVHRRFVLGSDARMVMPDSYRRIGTDPETWLRVPGYSVPPDAHRAERPAAPVPPAPAAGISSGPVSNIGSAVIHGPYINGSVHGNGLF